MALHEADIPEDDEREDEGPLSRITVSVEVKIDGSPVSWVVSSLELNQEAFEHHVLKVSLTADLTSPDFKTQLDATNSYHGLIGKSINVIIKPTEDYAISESPLEFAGLVTNLHISSRGDSLATVIVEAKSPTIKMDFVKKFRAFLNASRANVADQLIGAYAIEKAGIEFSGDATYTPEYMIQWQETDWDFLVMLASVTNSWLYYDGKKLQIATAATQNQKTLVWAKSVGSINISLNAQQINHTVRGWDHAQKQAFVGQQSSSTSFSGLAQRSFAGSRELSSETSNSAADSGFHSNEVKLLAQSLGREAVSGLMEGTIQTNVPSIKVGDTVKLEEAGAAYNGVYFVTGVTHHIEGNVGYFNELEVLPLEAAVPSRVISESRVRRADPMPALVTNIEDPESRGRIKVQFPMLDNNGNPLESYWLPFVSPYAGRERGFYFIPEIDDQVLVIFENGDPTQPVVIGSMWNGRDLPPAGIYTPDNDNKIIYTRSGHQLIFREKSGEEKIEIIDKTGKNTIVIDSANNTVTITADKDIVLKAKENISMEAGKAFTVKATNDVSIESSSGNATLKASQGITIDGMSVDATAKGNMNMKANGQFNAEGAIVGVTGKGPVTVSGKPIALN
jgi:uncharacterized protein involved in type VI secretion and phage assembly